MSAFCQSRKTPIQSLRGDQVPAILHDFGTAVRRICELRLGFWGSMVPQDQVIRLSLDWNSHEWRQVQFPQLNPLDLRQSHWLHWILCVFYNCGSNAKNVFKNITVVVAHVWKEHVGQRPGNIFFSMILSLWTPFWSFHHVRQYKDTASLWYRFILCPKPAHFENAKTSGCSHPLSSHLLGWKFALTPKLHQPKLSSSSSLFFTSSLAIFNFQPLNRFGGVWSFCQRSSVLGKRVPQLSKGLFGHRPLKLKNAPWTKANLNQKLYNQMVF